MSLGPMQAEYFVARVDACEEAMVVAPTDLAIACFRCAVVGSDAHAHPLWAGSTRGGLGSCVKSRRRRAGQPSEEAGEVARIRKPDRRRDFGDIQFGVMQQSFRFQDAPLLNDLKWR